MLNLWNEQRIVAPSTDGQGGSDPAPVSQPVISPNNGLVICIVRDRSRAQNIWTGCRFHGQLEAKNPMPFVPEILRNLRPLVVSGVGCFFLRDRNQFGCGWRVDGLVDLL